MRSQRTLRLLAALLSLSLVCAVPAHAGSVKFAEVEARTSAAGQRGRSAAALRLHNMFQQGGKLAPSGGESTRQGTPGGSSLLSTPIGVPQGGRVETIELGEVNGTICDCGEISVPGGGFPRLPFLALAAVPLLFLGGRGGGNGRVTNLLLLTPIPPAVIVTPTPLPVVTPPTTAVPEPATLLLLGSGLLAFAARARRRSRRRRTADGFAVGAREAV